MDSDQERFEKFLRQAEPFVPLWLSIRVACLTVLYSGDWINLATRVSLTESIPGKPIRIQPSDQFAAFSVDLPVEVMEDFLKRLVLDGVLSVSIQESTPTWEPRDVLLHRPAREALLMGRPISPGPWHGPIKEEVHLARKHYGLNRNCTTLSLYPDDVRNVMNEGLREELDTHLRLSDPPYDGIGALLKEFFPGVEIGEWDRTFVNVVAEFPFDVQYGSRTLELKAPKCAFEEEIQARIFFEPTSKPQQIPIRISDEPSELNNSWVGSWSYQVDWPEGAEQARVALFFKGIEVSSLVISRWPAAPTLRAALYSYFDPEQKKLKKAILDAKDTQMFEHAMVRLFNLLGIPVVWYGEGVTEGKADAGGLLEFNDQKLVVLIECTREDPSRKYSALKARARELEEFLEKQAEVLPVVVTESPLADPDISGAVEYGVSLVGREELEKLLDMVESRTSIEETIDYLRKLVTSLH